MLTKFLPPEVEPSVLEKEAPLSGHGNGNGFRGGDFDQWPGGGPFDHGRRDKTRRSIPKSVYRAGMLVGIVSIVCVFATLTTVLRLRWAHSKDWVSLSLPHGLLYLNTIVLLVSSVTIELARRGLRDGSIRRAALFLLVTFFLGVAFLAGQYQVWQEMVARGFYLVSNPGSFFFYVLTACHGVHLVGGIVGLFIVALRLRSFEKKHLAETAIDVISLYWHFMDGLWLYLLALLLATVQQ
jgi:cytochrome c oxidase subunit 3